MVCSFFFYYSQLLTALNSTTISTLILTNPATILTFILTNSANILTKQVLSESTNDGIPHAIFKFANHYTFLAHFCCQTIEPRFNFETSLLHSFAIPGRNEIYSYLERLLNALLKWRCGLVVDTWIRNQKVPGSSPGYARSTLSPWERLFTPLMCKTSTRL